MFDSSTFCASCASKMIATMYAFVLAVTMLTWAEVIFNVKKKKKSIARF